MPRPRFLLAPLLALILALPAPALVAQVHLPALGESASADFSVADERRLGEQIMRSVWRDPEYLDDPVLLAYIQSLWSPLVSAGRRLGHIGADIDSAFSWDIFLVRDRSVNAFALPGGHVGVHLGLIAMTTSRDELASVLAHELSHVTQRHIARSIGSGQRAGMVSVAAMILALVAASRAGNSDMAQAAIVGGQAAMIQGQLNFSRDVEREADRIGFGMLHDAEFAPAGMASMFERLAQANRINDSGSFPYLRSHPLTTDRISEARARVQGSSAPAVSGDGMLHAVMGARARVLMDTRVESLRRLQTTPVDAPSVLERLPALHAVALASSRLGEHGAARASAERALALAAGQPAPVVQASRWLLAEILLEAGEVEAAARQLAPADGARGDRPTLLLRAQVALAAARQAPQAHAATLRELTESLQTWTTLHPGDALAWATLGRCAEAVGLPLRAARAAAEARAARGDFYGAIDVLRATQRRAPTAGATDLVEAQVIDARLRALVAKVREELRERGLPSDRLGGE